MSERPQRRFAPPSRHLVVLAASAGGMDALRTICTALPADFPAAIAIVQHRTARRAELLAELLAKWTSLDVQDAIDGATLRPGVIYVAPPDRHMTVTRRCAVALTLGHPINHVLSSADPLLRSAALAYRERLTAVVLTGGNSDGAAGVIAVARYGGMSMAQDPATAVCSNMPRSAIATGAVSRILPLGTIAAALVARVRVPASSERERPVAAP